MESKTDQDNFQIEWKTDTEKENLNRYINLLQLKIHSNTLDYKWLTFYFNHNRVSGNTCKRSDGQIYGKRGPEISYDQAINRLAVMTGISNKQDMNNNLCNCDFQIIMSIGCQCNGF